MNVEAERTLEIKIDKTFPVAAHNGPFVVNEGDAILLNGASSYDALSGIASIAWSIDGDGQFDDGNPVPFHGIDGPSTHMVALRVVDVAGNVTILVGIPVTVVNVAPSCARCRNHQRRCQRHDSRGGQRPRCCWSERSAGHYRGHHAAHGTAVIRDGLIIYAPSPGLLREAIRLTTRLPMAMAALPLQPWR